MDRAPWHSKKPRYGAEGSAAVEKRRQAFLASGEPIPKQGENAPFYGGPAFEVPELGDDDLLDGDTVREALAAMHELATKPEQPFFLAVGFANPHVPWVAPKKYFDLYSVDELPLPDNRYPPRHAPPFAATSGADFFWYGTCPRTGTSRPSSAASACRATWPPSATWTPAWAVSEELDRLKLSDNTIVVFWGDHGYYMGEHNWWGAKHNNYEGATRGAANDRRPRPEDRRPAQPSVGRIRRHLPVAGRIVRPGPARGRRRSGRQELRPLLNDPNRPWKPAAFSEYPKGGYQGTAMRTDRYRYVRWLDKQGQVAAEELYHHQADPAENENLAGKAENRELLDQLARQMSELAKAPVPAGTKPKASRKRKSP